jgi:Fe-S-cluster containining protein
MLDLPVTEEGEEHRHNPCATCGACCRSYLVPVYGYDVWRLSTRQRLSPEQYVILVPEEVPRPEAFRLQAAGNPYTLALDKKGRLSIQRPCVFLLELPGNNDRCGVYGDRPVACQTYPMSLWNGVVGQQQKTLCPPNAWPLVEVERPHWHRKLTRLHMHLDIYGEVVARWNARVAAYPAATFVVFEYLSYLLNVYDRLAALDVSLEPETMDTVEASWPTFPRPALDSESLARRADHAPWLDYFARARDVIDAFYPEIAPLPPSLGATADV